MVGLPITVLPMCMRCDARRAAELPRLHRWWNLPEQVAQLVDDVGLLVAEVGQEGGQGVVNQGQFIVGELDINHVENATVRRPPSTRDRGRRVKASADN